jgi:flagellar hook-associated protein 2
MALSSSGLGSGLDIQGIISSLMAVEKQPLQKLDVKEAATQARISAFGTLKSSLSSVRTAAAALQDISKFIGLKANSSDSLIASFSSKAGASVGSYTLEVLELANNQKLTSKQGAFTAESQVLANASALGASGKGQITLSFGDENGANPFIPNASKTPVVIDLDPGADGNLTLAEVRDQINAKKAGVTASLVKVADGDVRLSLVSTDTGKANGIKIDVTGVSAGTNINKLAYNPDTDPVTAGFEVLAGNEAKNAQIKLNGVLVERSSNTLTDVVENTTITLSKKSTTPINLSVSSDSGSVSGLVEAFVKAFNDANKMLKDASAYNEGSKQGAILNGDSTVRSAQSQLRGLLSMQAQEAGDLKMLSNIGVAIQADGSLKFDKTKLDKAISNSPEDVAKLFGAYDKTANPTAPPEVAKKGLAYQFDQVLKGIVDNKGIFDTKVDGLRNSVRDIGKQRDALNLRLVDVEKRYRDQFTALDVSLAKIQQTSSWLSQQLASLSASNL